MATVKNVSKPANIGFTPVKLQRELKMLKNPNFENTKTIDRTMQWT